MSPKTVILSALLCLLLLSGCIPDESARSQEEEELPKTKEEILALAEPMLAPFRDASQVGLPMPPPVRDDMLRQLSQLIVEHGYTEEGQAAMKELSVEVKVLAMEARDQELWELVRDYIDLYEILGMHSEVLAYIDQQAVENMARPKVKVNGFLEDKESGVTTIFISLLDRNTGILTSTRRREGEEFEGLKIIKIIGKNDAVLFEYMPIEGLIFEVPSFEAYI